LIIIHAIDLKFQNGSRYPQRRKPEGVFFVDGPPSINYAEMMK